MASYHRYTEASFIQVSWPRLVIWATLQRFVVGGITTLLLIFIILVLAPKHHLKPVEICFGRVKTAFFSVNYQF